MEKSWHWRGFSDLFSLNIPPNGDLRLIMLASGQYPSLNHEPLSATEMTLPLHYSLSQVGHLAPRMEVRRVIVIVPVP